MSLVSVHCERDTSERRASDLQAAADNQPGVLLKHNGDPGFNRQCGSFKQAEGLADIVRAVRCVPRGADVDACRFSVSCRGPRMSADNARCNGNPEQQHVNELGLRFRLLSSSSLFLRD